MTVNRLFTGAARAEESVRVRPPDLSLVKEPWRRSVPIP